IRYPKTFGW
nr:Chain C, Nef IW9 peptide from Protein Nef [Simian immunodeficiency virus]3RWC_F Chain F, Nef IW9 peptide from Protein Nef [Simian immunodeficiency virus]